MNINVQQLAKNLVACATEKVGVGIYIDPAEIYQENHRLVPGFTYAVRLSRGSIAQRTLEIWGRSSKSLEEAFENAFAQLFEAGQLSARLEPAAQPKNNWRYSHEDCPGHVSSIGDARVCANCGANIEEVR